MEEARQELKNLMNELFVEDLKTKADNLSNSIASQFQGAVNTFKRNFDEMVDGSIEKIVEPKFSLVTEKYSALQVHINDKLHKHSEEIDNRLTAIESNLDQLSRNQDNKLVELGGSLRSSTNSLLQKIDESDNKITKSVSETRGELNQTIQASKQETLSNLEGHSSRTISTFNNGKEEISSALSDGIKAITAVKDEIGKNMEEITSAMGDEREEISEVKVEILNGNKRITNTLSDEREEIKAVKCEINERIAELENKITNEEQTHNKYNLVLTLLMIINVILVMVLLFRN